MVGRLPMEVQCDDKNIILRHLNLTITHKERGKENMAMITRTAGFGIIGTRAYFPDPAYPTLSVSYPDDTYVQEFATKELLMAAHKQQFPDQHREQFPEEYGD
jgi:hypothetical protein